jgi:hypothetical protein
MTFGFGGSIHQPSLFRVQADAQRLLARLLRWQLLASHAALFYGPARAVSTKMWLRKTCALPRY